MQTKTIQKKCTKAIFKHFYYRTYYIILNYKRGLAILNTKF